MKLVRRVLGLAVVLILLVALFQNQKSLGSPLEFSFLKWTFSLVLGFWIFFALVGGAALFALVTAWKGLWWRREIRRRDQEIARLQKELSGARPARSKTGEDARE